MNVVSLTKNVHLPTSLNRIFLLKFSNFLPIRYAPLYLQTKNENEIWLGNADLKKNKQYWKYLNQ